MNPVPERGDRCASKSRVSFAATSGMRSPATGTSPSRARPSRTPRRRIARSSSGSRPSWSRNVDHACACTRSSSAVHRTGAPSPPPVASATSACSAVASAAGSATVRVRSSSRMIVHAASAPSSPAASAAATRGNAASSGSPVNPTGPGWPTRARCAGAPRTPDACVTRSTSSTAERHPRRVDRRWSPSSTRDRSATSPAHAARCASTSRPSASSAPVVREQLVVGPSGRLVEPEHVGEHRAELLECFAGAGHGSILAGHHRHSMPPKSADQPVNNSTKREPCGGQVARLAAMHVPRPPNRA